MQELNMSEVDEVSGGGNRATGKPGIGWKEGASLVAGLSMWSPVTACFGLPIAGAMLWVGYYAD